MREACALAGAAGARSGVCPHDAEGDKALLGDAEMIRIVVEVRNSTADVQGIKESLAVELERFGDTRVVSVQEVRDGVQERLF